jgi:hypothetical protein
VWRVEYPVGSGFVRRARVTRMPIDWKGFAPLPLVVILHDEGSNASELMKNPKVTKDGSNVVTALGGFGGQFDRLMRDASDNIPTEPTGTFALLAPEGTSLGRPIDPADLSRGDQACWNSGHRSEDAISFQADDVGFIVHLIRELRERYTVDLLLRPGIDPTKTGHYIPSPIRGAIDMDRIYLVGIGNGGMMVYRLVNELPTHGIDVRAAAVIGATYGGYRYSKDELSQSAPLALPEWKNIPGAIPGLVFPRPFDLLVIHGANDQNVVIPTGSGLGAVSVAESTRIAGERPDLAALSAAERLAPWDYSPIHSRLAWTAYFESQAGPALTVTYGDTIIRTQWQPDGAPPAEHALELELLQFASTWPTATSVYIAQVTDLVGVAGAPPWDPWRVIWDFFVEPTSILEAGP